MNAFIIVLVAALYAVGSVWSIANGASQDAAAVVWMCVILMWMLWHVLKSWRGGEITFFQGSGVRRDEEPFRYYCWWLSALAGWLVLSGAAMALAFWGSAE